MVSTERKIELYGYLQNYMKQKENHEDYIDYYELCGFHNKMSIEELYKKMRNVKRVLHPDQTCYVEEIFQQSFLELTEKVKDMEEIFSNFRLKEEYDSFLEQKKNHRENVIQDEEKLKETMKIIVNQKGISGGLTSLMNIVFLDRYEEIPTDHSIRKSLEGLGKDRIISMIKSKNKDIMEQNLANMVMNYYIDILDQTDQKKGLDSFYQVCVNTSKKYDKTEENYQLENALIRYISTQNTDGFTNEQGGRIHFINSNLNPNDISILMLVKIHEHRKEDENYSYANMLKQSFDKQITTFSKVIKMEVEKDKTSSKNTL